MIIYTLMFSAGYHQLTVIIVQVQRDNAYFKLTSTAFWSIPPAPSPSPSAFSPPLDERTNLRLPASYVPYVYRNYMPAVYVQYVTSLLNILHCRNFTVPGGSSRCFSVSFLDSAHHARAALDQRRARKRNGLVALYRTCIQLLHYYTQSHYLC